MKKIISMLLISFLLCLLPSVGYTYTITETQLQTLEQNFNKLRSNNEWYRKELTRQQESQKKLLEKSKNLQATLANSQNDLKKMNEQLKSASQSLKKSEARIKKERTFWIILSSALIFALAKR